jgi:hypothetical protein
MKAPFSIIDEGIETRQQIYSRSGKSDETLCHVNIHVGCHAEMLRLQLTNQTLNETLLALNVKARLSSTLSSLAALYHFFVYI